MKEPKEYDLEKPEEFQRLIREVLSYMEVSRNNGTDKEGREYAIKALRFIRINSKQLL